MSSYVSVHLLDLPYHRDKAYQYRIPEELRGRVTVGSLLVVPFGNGNKRMTAVAVRLSDQSDYARLKDVLSILDYPFAIPESFVPLAFFMKERFFCTFGQAFRTMLPPGVNVSTETYYVLSRDPFDDPDGDAGLLVRRVRAESELTQQAATEAFGEQTEKLLSSLVSAGILEKRSRVPKEINEKTVTSLSLSVTADEASDLLDGEERDGAPLTEKQKTLVEMLLHYPHLTLTEAAAIGGVSPAVVSALVRKGIVAKRAVRIDRSRPSGPDAEFLPSGPKEEMPLTDEQTAALDELTRLSSSGRPQAALLYGVTGSGKTRVIIETAKAVLDSGRSVIILLPEIGLTAQAEAVYRAAFGSLLTVIQSMLSVGERLDAFRAASEGTVRVVLGTRSAVFSPVRDLGLVVIDEEQEATFKSETTPHYHARDVARFRCAQSGALLLLASATPSVESFYKAAVGTYALLKLTRRVSGGSLPAVRIEDLRGDDEAFPDRLIGNALNGELLTTLTHGRQAILFANRRGYQSYLSCRSCGKTFECPHCSVSLTYHAYEGSRKTAGKLVCHYCGYTMPAPRVCPACGQPHIGYFGFGTQKLQEELEERYPQARIARMDADTTTAKDAHGQILRAFEKGESDILFGTQMVTKGLNFPAVDLVGVVSVDSLLYQNDFRAGERTFSLITQLVGRAGRAGQESKAVLQTYNPGNEILRLAAKQDYEAFYRSEAKLRKAVSFPPFCSLFALTVSSADEALCAKTAEEAGALLKDRLSGRDSGQSNEKEQRIRVYGPYPSGLYRIGNRYRQRILIKYSDSAPVRDLFAAWLQDALESCPKDVRLEPDANPLIV
ncbi:MAG: primosomal protein N' [Clostridia bacterium]|nr:primosomal protein N' [Clostridia bacterium]